MSDSGPPRTVAPATDTLEIDEAYCAACNQSFTIDALYCPNDGAKLVKLKAKPDTLIGRVFDNRYEVRAPLGHGGMGTVYRGWQLSVDREVAIKVIHPKLAAELAVTKRFLREARLASRLNQPNIVAVYDFGRTDDEILFLVMELLRGRPLSKDLEAGRPLAMKRVKTMGMQICDALDAAHTQGIIHRDLKPGNIVILDEPPGRDLIKILDFGLAKSLVQDNTSLVTKTDAILGTPLYMPPEQILGHPSNQTADLYSLGCILFQLVTGKPPYVGENVNVVLASHVRDPIPVFGTNVPQELVDTIGKLMEKDPANRFTSARLVHEAISAWPDDPNSTLTSRPVGRPPPGVKSDVIRSVVADSAVQFAMTTASGAPPVTNPSLDRPATTRRWLLPVFALIALAGIGFAVFKVTRGDTPPVSGGSNTAGAPVAPDSAPGPVGVDAAMVADDAAVGLAPMDAQVVAADAKPTAADARARTPDARIIVAPADARVRAVDARPAAVDAAVPLIPVDAAPVRPKAPVDALDLPLLPTK